jgi:hypothetical protein
VMFAYALRSEQDKGLYASIPSSSDSGGTGKA